MIELLVLLPVIFAVLFGIFDAAQTSRKDCPAESIFWKHVKEDWKLLELAANYPDGRLLIKAGHSKFTKFDLWYYGNNKFYPPHIQLGIFFNPMEEGKCADFWHQMKNCWTWCLSLIAISSALVGIFVGLNWALLALLTLHGVEGLTFNFFYKYTFRKKEYRNSRNIWDFIKKNVLSNPDYVRTK